MAGYHFGAVGCGSHFDDYISEHMQRHYRQMYLIVLHEMATLLRISSQLSSAARLGETGSDASGEPSQMIEIEKEFQKFNHLYRFTGVSNQLQAREMFDKLRKSLGLDVLYKEVREELDASARIWRAQRQENTEHRLSFLTDVATMAAVFAVVTGFFGMNVFVEHIEEAIFRNTGVCSPLQNIKCEPQYSIRVLLDLLLFCLLLGTISMVANRMVASLRNRLASMNERPIEGTKETSGLNSWLSKTTKVSFGLSFIWLVALMIWGFSLG